MVRPKQRNRWVLLTPKRRLSLLDHRAQAAAATRRHHIHHVMNPPPDGRGIGTLGNMADSVIRGNRIQHKPSVGAQRLVFWRQTGSPVCLAATPEPRPGKQPANSRTSATGRGGGMRGPTFPLDGSRDASSISTTPRIPTHRSVVALLVYPHREQIELTGRSERGKLWT